MNFALETLIVMKSALLLYPSNQESHIATTQVSLSEAGPSIDGKILNYSR